MNSSTKKQYLRQQRDEEMRDMIGRYLNPGGRLAKRFSNQHGQLIRLQPIKLNDAVEILREDESEYGDRGKILFKNYVPREGGEGKFYHLREGGERYGLKLFNGYGQLNDEQREKEIQQRRVFAKKLRNALKTILTLAQLKDNDEVMKLLFNYLNVPMSYVVGSHDELLGLFVPTYPRSCRVNLMNVGKADEAVVRLGKVISAESPIPPKQGDINDRMSSYAKWSLLDSLCWAIMSLHKLGLIHGDISGDNVYVQWPTSDDPKVYIIDAFNGLSAAGGNSSIGYRYSHIYCPESLIRCEYTPGTDVYQLAWWVVHLIKGVDPKAIKFKRPFVSDIEGRNPIVYEAHKYAVRTLISSRNELSKDLYHALLAALLDTPGNRPSALDLYYAVHDHWVYERRSK